MENTKNKTQEKIYAIWQSLKSYAQLRISSVSGQFKNKPHRHSEDYKVCLGKKKQQDFYRHMNTNIKTFIFLTLFVALIAYHFFGLIPTTDFYNWFGTKSEDTSLYTIIRIISALSVWGITMTNSFITRIIHFIFWQQYIGGNYLGNVFYSNNPNQYDKQIEIKIKCSFSWAKE